MCKIPPHLIYTQHVCYLCVCYFHHTSYYTQHVCYLCVCYFHHTSDIRNMYATCVYATSTTPHIRNMYATCVYATSTTPHIIRNMYATCVYATSTTPHIYATCMLLVCMLLPPHLIYTQHVCYLCVCYFQIHCTSEGRRTCSEK